MANHGAGTKFLSVNLNKSYGQTLQNPNLSSYGTSRVRSAGGGVGGGMVVLSRSRSSQKHGTKLSVPPPLNLPSLRKEHECHDSSGNGGGGAAVGGGGSGSGSRPTSSGMGWTKPVVAAIANNDRNGESQIVSVDSGVGGRSRGTGGVYVPPIGRPVGIGLPVINGPAQGHMQVEKVAVLRGEDFPSLRATLSSSVSSSEKQKDDSNQRQKQSMGEGVSNERQDSTSHFSSLVQNPPVQSSHQGLGQSVDNRTERESPADSCVDECHRKQVDLFDPLPLVRLNPRSDWADDERDTGHGLADRGRDYGVSKSDFYWDQEFDMRRGSFLPHKTGHFMFDKQGLRDNEAGKIPSIEVLRVDPYVMDVRAPGGENREGSSWRNSVSYERDIRTPNREGREVNTWRSSPAPKVGFNAQGISSSINGAGAGHSGLIRETGKDKKFVSATFRDSSERNVSGAAIQNQDSPVRGNTGYEQGGRLHSNNIGDPTIRSEQSMRDGNGSEQYNRYRSNNPQFNSPAKSTFSVGVKGLPMNDPLLNFGRDKKSFSKREKPSLEDPFGTTGFDEHDPFSGALVGVVKRKKEVLKQTEFHDPARESFEAELERVQKMQEQERKRIIEEQERALELAQREEEERLRLAREREERQRKLEDEAREAAWRAEQERLEAIQRAEEQRIARDEEKRRIEMEEERRKQAALQKLLELEERIARRQADAANSDSISSPAVATIERASSQNDIHRDDGFVSSRIYSRGGIADPQMGEVDRFQGHRWNLPGDGDQYGRSADMKSEFHENLDDRLGDFGWRKGNSQSPYADRSYQNPDLDDIYSYGRSRYSVRQPHVLPPPSLVSVHKPASKWETDHHNSSVLENDMLSETRREPVSQAKYGGSLENSEQSEMGIGHQDDAETEEQKLYSDTQLRCDSQSSFSISSPPCSPTHLSHVDLDESGNSRVLSSAEGKDGHGPENGPAFLTTQSCVSTGDDEEWSIENNQLQEQEEYDQVGEYQEVDEIQEGDEENTDFNEEFENLHLEHKGSPRMTDNMVLGFNEGVEVVISGDEHVTFNLHGERKNFQGADGSVQDDICSSGVQESEMTMMDPAIEPTDGLQTYTSPDVSSSVDVSNGSGQSPPTSTVPSSGNMTSESSSSQNLASTLTTVASQAEIPFKLQFGLFSGPSLIPSPVPSIQIGSIQMPLHLHPQVGPSLSHVHPSQAPLFQFGQLRYTSPISEGLLPLAPQTMGFIQPNLPAQFLAHQNPGAPHAIQPNHNHVIHDMVPPSVENQPGIISRQIELSQDVDSLHMVRSEQSIIDGREADSFLGNNGNINDKREPGGKSGSWSPDPIARERVTVGSRAPGPVSGGRGKKFVFNAKNSGSRSQFLVAGTTRIDSGGFHRKPRRGVQRIEFRIRENSDKKESAGWVPSNHLGEDDRLSFNGNGKGIGASARTEPKRGASLSKQSKQNNVSERPAVIGSKEITSTSKTGSQTGKEAGQCILRSGEGSLKRNIGEGVDAPLQSGIVRIYEQPGIEVPSDEDDFIEVRSKRQMLNDRREQKEKEIKAKSRLAKNVQNRRSVSQNTTMSSSSNRSYSFSSAASQILAPIGTPALNADTQLDLATQTIKSYQTSSGSTLSSSSKDLGLGPPFESKVLDDVQTSLGAWTNSRVGKQVMPLTQSQLDEAMKPGRYDSHVSSIGDCSIGVLDMSSSSILPKGKSFSSSASPINSLLAGEKIQFGAVTSPTVLPSSSRAISNGIGPPGSCRSDIQISHNLATGENNCTLFFEKENNASNSHPHLEDPEDEAEAAASAVAVAAITSDEVIGSGLGTNPISMSDSKNFGVDIDEISSGVNGDQKSVTQSRTEESLSLSLPADLSVETPPTSVWQPLQSPQNSTSQMLSHFPGGPPCHFPFYEMNPMLGGPIFAFGPQDESAGGNQSRSQKNNAPVSAPIGTWQQCNSGMDSFQGPPAGFTGPFVSPPGGIPGFQGPPHMVVYNHFAPVGQFGQVGLNYVGTTYIPSGKQPDWKHNPTSSAMGMSEGNMNNISMVSGQRNPPNLPTPIQHLAPGAPLLPLASPMAMFDASPFQSSLDMSTPARWSHLPASSLNSVYSQLTLQQQAESIIPSHFTNGPTMDQSLIPSNRFSNSRSSAPSDGGQSFSLPTVASVAHFSEELGLMEPSTSAAIEGSVPGVSPGGAVGVASIKDVGSSTDTSSHGTTSGRKIHPSQQKSVHSQQQGHSGGYNYPRGGVASQKSGTGGKWSHRPIGFHGRNKSLGAEKNFHSSKVKQIYVAKQPSGGTSSAI